MSKKLKPEDLPPKVQALLKKTQRKRAAQKAAHTRHSQEATKRAWNYVEPE